MTSIYSTSAPKPAVSYFLQIQFSLYLNQIFCLFLFQDLSSLQIEREMSFPTFWKLIHNVPMLLTFSISHVLVTTAEFLHLVTLIHTSLKSLIFKRVIGSCNQSNGNEPLSNLVTASRFPCSPLHQNFISVMLAKFNFILVLLVIYFISAFSDVWFYNFIM